MKFKNKAKLKATLLSAAAIATSCLIGMASACTTTTDKKEEDDKTVTKQDVQLIKNGNFEFYDDNDGLYPISTPDNWTSGNSGSSSSAMGGVINTSKDRWDYLTDPELPKTLKDNNDLNSDDENKKDYNGALDDDMLYKNTHDATKSDAKDEEKAYIANPLTHKYEYDDKGVMTTETYEKDGKTYTDPEYKNELETSVLMLHNYRSAYYNGTETYYSSSSTITLEARTAAKFSVWVKTAELYFDGSKNERTKVENEHGAYIKIDTTVGGNSLDNFYIRNINTEKLNPDNANNGWVQYTVYVQASSFASTTVSVTLGLGQNDKYTVEGYAFFDDAEIKTYENAAEMIAEAEENDTKEGEKFGKLVEKSTANLLSPDAESEFRVDKVTFKTNDANGNIIDKNFDHNFADRHFYIDLTSSADDSAITFNSDSVAAGFTVEKTTTGRYVSSKNTDNTLYGVAGLDNGADYAYLPANFTGRRVTDDILATMSISGEDWQFNVQGSNGRYNEIMTDALKTATSLPGVENGETTALVMLSANGAAYEAELTNDAFRLEAGEYALLTFWIKTSDMDGKTAATVTVKDADEKSDNSSRFTIDSTTVDTVSINDKEDIYNGWVECFIRVENTSKEEAKQFKLCFNFGNTTIKGTSETNYKAGWLAVTNASVMELDEDVYGYTSSVGHSASLTLSDTESKSGNKFDSEQGDKNVIKNDLAIPSSYTGVNGNSAEVINLKDKTTEYDETNRNAYAGLLNKENLENYKSNWLAGGCKWYSAIAALETVNTDDLWNEFAGKYSVQPLLIVNTVREFAKKTKGIYNYGYIGSNSSVSANGYTAVSVRVKVSAGAVANVYLVDTDVSSKEVLGFSLPKFTFWYDDDGNILKGEPKEKASAAEMKANIAYNLRADGLYELAENGDGKLYANFYNLNKYYDYDLENEKFFDADGNPVAFEQLVQGETYYADASGAKGQNYAPHYLVAGDKNKVYKYNAGVGNSATYYYMVNGKADTDKVVYGVDTSKATLRYDNTDKTSYPYQFTIDATTAEGAAKYKDKWVTVTFYLHAGSEAKSYKLELWSGYRDQEVAEGVTEDSYVMFDYNSVSLSESTYNELVGFYTDAIIDEYKKVITDEQDKLSDSIADYEKLADKVDTFNYEAKYYTYTLYDSASYVPFNADTANDDETGYAYNYSDYSEKLAYLTVEDFDGSEYSMSAFVDYSNFDKDISLGKNTTVDNDDNNTNETDTNNNTNFWLLLASIILLAAILIAILAIIIKDLIKKLRRNKKSGKNTYNFNKNKRYVRKYVKANGEVTKVEEGSVDESLLTDKVEEPVEETPVEEAPAEEAPVEEAHAEEAPAEQTPAEDKPAEENNDDGENKE